MARMFGFDSAWAIDHFMGLFPDSIWGPKFTWYAGSRSPHAHFDYQTFLGALAGSAGRIQLGVGVTEPIRRHPVLIAQFAMTLSHLTKRPPILGIGAGERENTEPYGLDFSQPVAKLEEALQIIRTCFSSSGPFEFRGEHWQMPDAVMDLTPKKGNTPEIWIAAHGPRMLRLTGVYGDGWYPVFPLTPAEYGERLATIRGHAAKAGRDPFGITAGMSAFVAIGRTEAKARAMLEHPALRFLALLAPATMWREAGAPHPMGSAFRGIVDFVPHRHSAQEMWNAIDAVPADFLTERIIWGDRKRVIERLKEYQGVGLEQVTIQPVSGLVSRREAVRALRSLISLRRAFD
jgi:phthiodiolone/phenolphthiodiolone dimycocerosates ketoreductase